jgi:ribonuclease HI
VHKAYCDGACRVSNPGICSCAFVIYKDEIEVHTEGKYLGPELLSNNFAEYQGLILLLEFLYTRSIRNVVIYTDSELVVNQTLGKWEVKQPDLKVLATKCYGLLVQGCHVLKHIKGHDGNKGNVRADEICNAVLDLHKEEYELYLYGKN